MKGIALLSAIFMVGCAASRVVPVDDTELLRQLRQGAPPEHLKVEASRASVSEGVHCFEPYLFFLTLGIIPTHCITRYEASLEAGQTRTVGSYKETRMAGWVALVLAPFPQWDLSFISSEPPDSESQVRNLAIERSK